MAESGDAADVYVKAYEVYLNRTGDSEWSAEAAKLIETGGKQVLCDYARITTAFSQTDGERSVRDFLRSLQLYARDSEGRLKTALANDLETSLAILGWRLANARSTDASEEGIVAFAGTGILFGICEPIREAARVRKEAMPWLDGFLAALRAFMQAKQTSISQRIGIP